MRVRNLERREHFCLDRKLVHMILNQDTCQVYLQNIFEYLHCTRTHPHLPQYDQIEKTEKKVVLNR